MEVPLDLRGRLKRKNALHDNTLADQNDGKKAMVYMVATLPVFSNPLLPLREGKPMETTYLHQTCLSGHRGARANGRSAYPNLNVGILLCAAISMPTSFVVVCTKGKAI